MKKILITLMVVALVAMAAGVVSANPDEPVSDKIGSGTDTVQDEKVIKEEPVTGEGKAEAEDYVRPSDDGELGITSAEGLEEEAMAYTAALTEESNPGKQNWIYIGAGALVVLFAAALLLRRKSSRA